MQVADDRHGEGEMAGRPMRIVFLPRYSTYPGEQDFIVTADLPGEVPPEGTPGIEVALVSSRDHASWSKLEDEA